MARSLSGRVALVTGAGGGLGRVVTRSLLSAGATVVGVDRSASPALSAESGFHAEAANLTEPSDVQRVVTRVLGDFKTIDILVHVMGGFAGGARVAETDDATWKRMMDMNLNSAFYVLRAVVPAMRAAGYGRIVAIGSRQAVQPAPGVGAYSASKAALVSLVQTVALENRDRDIRANVILPGTMDTAANRAAMPKADFLQWVQPAHVADLIVLLTAEAGSDINGAAIPIYGSNA